MKNNNEEEMRNFRFIVNGKDFESFCVQDCVLPAFQRLYDNEPVFTNLEITIRPNNIDIFYNPNLIDFDFQNIEVILLSPTGAPLKTFTFTCEFDAMFPSKLDYKNEKYIEYTLSYRVFGVEENE